MSKVGGTLLVFTAVLILSLIAVLPASAQGSCDALVADDANVFGEKIGNVEAAAQDLVNAGADVRVYTIKTYSSVGNLDKYESEVESECSSWRAADGGRKNNLIVLMVAVENRKTGLYYGSQWTDALDAKWPQIQKKVMNPRFRDGDFAGGFAEGLQEVKKEIESVTTPPSRRGGSLVALWIVLAIVGIPAALLIGFFAYRARVSHRKERDKRAVAQQKARLAKQAAAARGNEWPERLQMLEIKVNAITAQMSDEAVRPFLNEFTGAKQMGDDAVESYSDLRQSAGDPDRAGRSEAEYLAVERAYQEVVTKLKEAEVLAKSLEGRIARFSQEIAEIPDKLAEAGKSIEVAEQSIETARGKGFKTTVPDGNLANARLALEQAKTSQQEKRLSDTVKHANRAKEEAKDAHDSAEGLLLKKQEVEAAIAALAARIETAKSLIEEGHDTFERINDVYAESSWVSIQGNGTEATNRVNWAIESLEDARVYVTMEEQEWQKSSELASEANTWLDQAESFMRSVKALETNLLAAKQDAPAEIEAAQTDIRKAAEYINTYDKDIRERLEDDLRTAEQMLDKARTELVKDMPDYLFVLKFAKDANVSADRILDQARSEHETGERLRIKASAGLRDARIEVSRTKEYIEDRSFDVGEMAESYLADAQRYLRDAEGAADPALKVSYAEKAQAAAKDAFLRARKDVVAAESDRHRRRMPSYSTTYPRVPTTVIVRHHDTDWGSSSQRPHTPSRPSSPKPSKGSKSWSPSSRGGGGSTSIGTSKRGSGGSTKW